MIIIKVVARIKLAQTIPLCSRNEPIKRDQFYTDVMCGEMSGMPLDQLTTLVDSVSYALTSVNILY